jgi:hypothetical protein
MIVRTFLGGETTPLPLISQPARSIQYEDPPFTDLDEAANLMTSHRSPHVVAVLQVSRNYFGLPGRGRKLSTRGVEA